MSSHPDPRSEHRPAGLTHPLDVGYLVVGLVLLGIAGIWALSAGDVVDTRQTSLLLPLVLVGAGVLGLAAFTAKGVSRRRQERRTDDRDPLQDDQPSQSGPTEETLRLDDLRG